MLRDGLEIGEDLARVEFVGQGVHHRMGGVLGHFLNTVLAEGAPHHTIGHTIKHARRVGHRFATPQLGTGLVDDQRIAAEFRHADGEAGAGTGARLVENNGDALWTGEWLVIEAVLVELDGQFQHLLLFFVVQIVIAQHMAQFRGCHWYRGSFQILRVRPRSVVRQVGRNLGEDGHRLIDVLSSDDQRRGET